VSKYPQYEKIGLADLCQRIHLAYKQADIARLTTEVYVSNMIPAMRPYDAWAKLMHNEVERVSIDKLEGRITAVLLTPYPPGIPLLIPGERFNNSIIEYLKFARSFNQNYPGFETDVHGLVNVVENGKIEYYIDCVI
jgi:arginine decarboxylase